MPENFTDMFSIAIPRRKKETFQIFYQAFVANGNFTHIYG